MGVTTLSVAVANAANPDVTEHLEFIVASGAVYSVVPTPVLERLGDRFRLAIGTHIVRQRGGALSLETLGLTLDPIRRELKPMDLIL